jgi:hypothetical protein
VKIHSQKGELSSAITFPAVECTTLLDQVLFGATLSTESGAGLFLINVLSAHPAGSRHLSTITDRRDTITIVAASARVVIAANTQLDTIHLVVITDTGKTLADNELPSAPADYDEALRWPGSFATIAIAGRKGPAVTARTGKTTGGRMVDGPGQSPGEPSAGRSRAAVTTIGSPRDFSTCTCSKSQTGQ